MTDRQLEAWFDEAPDEQREMLTKTRSLIRSLGADDVEELKWGRACYSAGRALFCYLQGTSKHIALGFQHGASLTDPAGLLQGTGVEMRHVKLNPKKAPDWNAVLELVSEARRHAA